MSDLIPHKRTTTRSSHSRRFVKSPVELDFGTGERKVVMKLKDGTEGLCTCIGCPDAPCLWLGPEEVSLPGIIGAFPGDPSREVCPTKAISWVERSDVVEIDPEACIGCGLCVARCPYGAISMGSRGVALVESQDPSGCTVRTEAGEEPTEARKIPKRGKLGTVRNLALGRLPASVSSLGELEASQFVRNLLIQCGMACRVRRRGDTNIRMDGVLALGEERMGVLEVERGTGVLESPRALLEDVAVLHGRYAIPVDGIDPVSVLLSLPNQRSEYFQVIKDIEDVLGIRCRTLTVGTLVVIVWNFLRIEGFFGTLFATKPESTDLWKGMRDHISDTILETEPYDGAYRPLK